MPPNCSDTGLGSSMQFKDSGFYVHAPGAATIAVMMAAAFLPAIGLAHFIGLPLKIRRKLAQMQEKGSIEDEPPTSGLDGKGSMSFWSLISTDTKLRTSESKKVWSENQFRGLVDKKNRRLAKEGDFNSAGSEMNALDEPLLDEDDVTQMKEDEVWEEAPEWRNDDNYEVVFTHAIRPGTLDREPNSECWQPTEQMLADGVHIMNSRGLNWLERRLSARKGGDIDRIASCLLPHLDVELAQRRSNLYRPLYYSATDVRWCPETIHKTHRNILSKPDFEHQPKDEAGAAEVAGMTPEERAAALSAMSTTDRAAVLAAMSYRDEAAALAAMSDEERAAAEALKNVAWASEKTGNEKTGKSGTTYQRALECYMPEFFAMEQLYSVAMWFSAVLLVLMLPLVFDGIGNDNAAEYFHDQHVEMSTHSHWLWRTSWINADGRYGYAEWRDGYAMFVLTCRMLMMGLVLAWACFRHSQYDVMIDHPIGLQDFTVELRDLPADVSEKDVIEAFEKEDPELQIIKVMFIEASFNLKIDTTADDYEVAADEERADDEGANSVALVCFHSVAMHDQVVMTHHNPDYLGITNAASSRRDKKTALEVEAICRECQGSGIFEQGQERRYCSNCNGTGRCEQSCRVLPAGPPCDYLWDCFAWERNKHLNTASQTCLQVGGICFFLVSYFMLYVFYCQEYGVNPFAPDAISTQDGAQTTPSPTPQHTAPNSGSNPVPSSASDVNVDSSALFQTLALVAALVMPPVLIKVMSHFNTQTRHSYVVSSSVIYATLVGIGYFPMQIMAASGSIFSDLCASDELAIASLSGVSFYFYWIIFPFVTLILPPVFRLLAIFKITLSAKLSKRKVTQEELDAAYVLPPFDVIDHYYDLLYVVAICRIITGFTALALLSCCLTLYGTKRAMLYHLRYHSSAPKHACGTPVQHVIAVLMFLAVNTMVTIKHRGLLTDGENFQILIGVTPSTLFQGTKEALNYWPMLVVKIESAFLLVISIPEVLLLLCARFSYGWIYFLAMKKDLPRRRLKTIGAIYPEFATKCENYDHSAFTSERLPDQPINPENPAATMFQMKSDEGAPSQHAPRMRMKGDQGPSQEQPCEYVDI